MSVLSDSPVLSQPEVNRSNPSFPTQAGYAHQPTLTPYATSGVPFQTHATEAGMAYPQYHYPSSPPATYEPQHQIPPTYQTYGIPQVQPIQYHTTTPYHEQEDPELRRLAAEMEGRRRTLARNQPLLQAGPAPTAYEGKNTAAPPNPFVLLDGWTELTLLAYSLPSQGGHPVATLPTQTLAPDPRIRHQGTRNPFHPTQGVLSSSELGTSASSSSQASSSDILYIDPDLEVTPRPQKPSKIVDPEDSDDNGNTPIPLSKAKRSKTTSATYLVLGPEYYKAGRYQPVHLPDDYEPVSNKNEDPELIRRAPDPDHLHWAKLDEMSEAEQLAVRMGCNPEDHREIYSRRNYIYTRAFTYGVDLRVPWKTFPSDKKRSLIRHVYKKAQTKYGFDKELVEALMKSVCKNNVKNDNARSRKPTRRSAKKPQNEEANNTDINKDPDDPGEFQTPKDHSVKRKSHLGASQLGKPSTIKLPKHHKGTNGTLYPPRPSYDLHAPRPPHVNSLLIPKPKTLL